jgi:hypothetical protein
MTIKPASILNYGSVELHLYRPYYSGEVLKVTDRLHIKVVDCVEEADGIIILAKVPRLPSQRPGCTCVLFTHYMRHLLVDRVDHVATITHLSLPTESIRLMTERAFIRDLMIRSTASSLAYQPEVRYL